MAEKSINAPLGMESIPTQEDYCQLLSEFTQAFGENTQWRNNNGQYVITSSHSKEEADEIARKMWEKVPPNPHFSHFLGQLAHSVTRSSSSG